MFETFKKPLVYAMIIVFSSMLLFFLQLVIQHSFSFLAVVAFLIGLAIRHVIQASKDELNQLRLEIIALRKRIDKMDKANT